MHANRTPSRDGAFWIGSPHLYRQVQPATDGPLPGGTPPNPYALRKDVPNTTENQPAFWFFPPGGPQRTYPHMGGLEELYFTGPDGGLPYWFRPANRAPMTVNTPDGGKPEGLRMMLLSPMRYNATVLTRRTYKDTRKQPGRAYFPSRKYIPGVPVGS